MINLKKVYDIRNELDKLSKQMDNFIKELITDRLENDNVN